MKYGGLVFLTDINFLVDGLRVIRHAGQASVLVRAVQRRSLVLESLDDDTFTTKVVKCAHLVQVLRLIERLGLEEPACGINVDSTRERSVNALSQDTVCL